MFSHCMVYQNFCPFGSVPLVELYYKIWLEVRRTFWLAYVWYGGFGGCVCACVGGTLKLSYIFEV